MYSMARSAKTPKLLLALIYFIEAVANNLNAKCSFRCPYSEQFACFFLVSKEKVSKKQT
jgi:hypothetical protein